MTYGSKVVLLLVLYSLLGVEAAVQIINEPEDIAIEEGGVAKFNCTYTGTTAFPYWRINDRLYPTDLLPSNHSYYRQMLIVQDVQLSDNGTQYQCVFIGKRSRIAILYVYPINGVDDISHETITRENPTTAILNGDISHEPTTRENPTTVILNSDISNEPTTKENSTTTIINDDISHEPTRMLTSENPTTKILNGDTYGHLWMINATTTALPSTKKFRFVITIGLCIAVMIVVLLAVLFLAIILRMRIKQKNIINLEGQAPDMPIYESIDNEDGARQDPKMVVYEEIPPTVVFELKENDSYNIVSRAIKLKENVSYISPANYLPNNENGSQSPNI